MINVRFVDDRGNWVKAGISHIIPPDGSKVEINYQPYLVMSQKFVLNDTEMIAELIVERIKRVRVSAL